MRENLAKNYLNENRVADMLMTESFGSTNQFIKKYLKKWATRKLKEAMPASLFWGGSELVLAFGQLKNDMQFSTAVLQFIHPIYASERQNFRRLQSIWGEKNET